ncbi:MAG: dihydroorotase [Euzebyaceae bacterium]|nr:dihydroorotase [Euzebyaceae bacterium]
MSGFTLTGARVVDPAGGRDEVANVSIDGEIVVAVGGQVQGTRVDADGLVLAPGLVDLHVHLREPGREDAETVESGTAAAAAGGFTAVCPMANTDPVCDHAGVVEQVSRLAREAGHCDVYPIGAITRGLRGEELAEMGAMAAQGVRCFSDDGMPVRSAQVMRRALEYARTWDAIICNHAEEAALTWGEGGRGATAGGRGSGGAAGGGGGADAAQMNEGELSSLLGLAGWPHEAEEVMVARDLILARGRGARLHVPHVSTAGAVDLIRDAKARGARVTAEAAPHHFTLVDELVTSYDPVYKVNPPLRTKDDVEAVRRGLADGTIDAIATDHAPHPPEQKEQEWAHAPCGMLGLETALAVTLTQLVGAEPVGTELVGAERPVLTLSQALAALSTNPARSRDIGGHGGPIQPGGPANLVLFDPAQRWTVDERALHSRSRNTPFAGTQLRGRVVSTLLRGRFTFRDGALA